MRTINKIYSKGKNNPLFTWVKLFAIRTDSTHKAQIILRPTAIMSHVHVTLIRSHCNAITLAQGEVPMQLQRVCSARLHGLPRAVPYHHIPFHGGDHHRPEHKPGHARLVDGDVLHSRHYLVGVPTHGLGEEVVGVVEKHDRVCIVGKVRDAIVDCGTSAWQGSSVARAIALSPALHFIKTLI